MTGDHALAQLRHLYAQMIAGEVRNTAEAARGLLGPAIAELERIGAASSPVAGPQKKTQVSQGASVPCGTVAMEGKPTGCDEAGFAGIARFLDNRDAVITEKAYAMGRADGIEAAARECDDEKRLYLEHANANDAAGAHIAGTNDLRCALACDRDAVRIRALLTSQPGATPGERDGAGRPEALAKSDSSSESAAARSSGDEGERT